jgi:hypothetical protein
MTEAFVRTEIRTLLALVRSAEARLRILEESARPRECSRLGCDARAIYHYDLCEEHRCQGCQQPRPIPGKSRNPVRRSARLNTPESPLGTARRM